MATNRRSFIKYASLAAAGNAAGLRPFGLLELASRSRPRITRRWSASSCTAATTPTTRSFSSTRRAMPTTRRCAGRSRFRRRSCCSLADAVKLRAQPQPARHPDAVQQQNGRTGDQCRYADGADHARAVPGRRNRADEPVFAYRPAAGMAERGAIRAVTPTGWAGRIADTLTPQYNPGGKIPMITSVAGDTLFCNGADQHPGLGHARQPRRRHLLGRHY